jgi:phosphoesterase RecJ-like protein
MVADRDRQAVLAELRAAQRVVVATHENPDGDALGSLVAMHRILRQLRKDSVMYVDASDLPLPREYSFLALDGLVCEPPTDLPQRTRVFLDCGNLERNPAEALKHPDARIVNIDHHHDNTRFGTVNLVVPEASCTAEIVWDLMGDLGVTADLQTAEALYVGLVTDTGRFMYENTGARAHRMAAELIEAGVDVARIYRHVYEEIPFGKLALLARGLANARRFDDGRLTLTSLREEDYRAAGAEESFSEGVVDHLRAVDGTAVAALVRDRVGGEGAGAPAAERLRKVSLRASDDRVDVSRIARAQGGGGHRRAAGFQTAMADSELVAFLREQIGRQLADHQLGAPDGDRHALGAQPVRTG